MICDLGYNKYTEAKILVYLRNEPVLKIDPIRERHGILPRKLRVDFEAQLCRGKFSTKIPASGLNAVPFSCQRPEFQTT
jgi:hypothetical protein